MENNILKQIGEQVHRAIMDGIEPTNDIAKQMVEILKVGRNEKIIDIKCTGNTVNDNTVISSELLRAFKQYSER
jgi:hypothetical protein